MAFGVPWLSMGWFATSAPEANACGVPKSWPSPLIANGRIKCLLAPFAEPGKGYTGFGEAGLAL